MVAQNEGTAGAELVPGTSRDGADRYLVSLCAEFFRQADLRTREGERLDRLDWSNDVDAGYLQLSRGAHDYRAMLEAILATTPTTLQGLVAKAYVISRHQQDQEAEPIPSCILAADVIRLLAEPSPCVAPSAISGSAGHQDAARCGGGRW